MKVAPAGDLVETARASGQFTTLIKALDATGYDGWGISEQPGNQSKDAAALKDLSERMDKIFAS